MKKMFCSLLKILYPTVITKVRNFREVFVKFEAAFEKRKEKSPTPGKT